MGCLWVLPWKCTTRTAHHINYARSVSTGNQNTATRTTTNKNNSNTNQNNPFPLTPTDSRQVKLSVVRACVIPVCFVVCLVFSFVPSVVVWVAPSQSQPSTMSRTTHSGKQYVSEHKIPQLFEVGKCCASIMQPSPPPAQPLTGHRATRFEPALTLPILPCFC